MHFTPILATALVLLCSVGAVPIESDSINPAVIDPASTIADVPESLIEKRITPNTQSCKATQFLWRLHYEITIGIHYANGKGCNSLLGRLKHAVKDDFSGWKCNSENKGKDTKLEFWTKKGVGKELNAELQKAYPTVKGGFNCPSK